MSTADLDAPAENRTDFKIEVLVVPVSDVDKARAFYADILGWRVDADVSAGTDFRLVHVTPPGSPCSVMFGTGLTQAAPGSAQSTHLVVSDIEAACAELVRRGIQISEVYHCSTGFACRFPFPREWSVGAAPDRRSYGSFASFEDPDGNLWILQEVTSRLPGRVDPTMTTYGSVSDLAQAMKRAETAHGEHEKRTGQPDAEWADWYASYMIAEQSGAPLPR